MTWRPAMRLGELALLTIAIAFAGLGFTVLTLVDGTPLTVEALLPAIAIGGLALLVHLGFSGSGQRFDQVLFPIAVLLAGCGIVFVARLISTELAWRQVIWFGLSVLALLVTLLVMGRTNILRRYKYSWAVAGFLLVVATFFLGRPAAPGGPRLWFDLGLFQFQPSEIWKVLLVVFFAGYLDEYSDVLAAGSTRLGPLRLPPIPYLIPLGVMFTLSMALLFVQRDLGAALLMFGVFVAMLFTASGRWSLLALTLAAFAAGVLLSYQTVGLFRERVDIWLDPFAQSSGTGYQIVQGLLAFAAGGVFGQGLGQGAPIVVPAIHTDYMLAAIGEELGWLGAVAIVLVYLLLALRAFGVAVAGRSRYDQLLATGLATVLGFQAIIIMAGVLKLIPLTGITMPFLSYGGSSLLTNFVILGLLLHMSRPLSRQALADA